MHQLDTYKILRLSFLFFLFILSSNQTLSAVAYGGVAIQQWFADIWYGFWHVFQLCLSYWINQPGFVISKFTIFYIQFFKKKNEIYKIVHQCFGTLAIHTYSQMIWIAVWPKCVKDLSVLNSISLPLKIACVGCMDLIQRKLKCLGCDADSIQNEITSFSASVAQFFSAIDYCIIFNKNEPHFLIPTRNQSFVVRYEAT